MQIAEHTIDENKLFIKWRDIHILPSAVEQPHRHNYFQFMLLEKVSGTHEIDFETYDARPKSLHFVGKGRVHKVNFEPDVKGGVLLFPEEIFGGSDNDIKLLTSFSYFDNGAYPILPLNNADFLTIHNLVEQIKQNLQHASLDVSKYLLFALLAKVRSIYMQTEGASISKKIPQEMITFNVLLKKHACSWNAVDDFTKEIGITNARMNNLCKMHYGKTTLQLLHDRKLLEAKRMLVYTDKQVKEIAYDCGFEDVAYFNRFFKKQLGVSPGNFRKSH